MTTEAWKWQNSSIFSKWFSNKWIQIAWVFLNLAKKSEISEREKPPAI